MSQGSPWPLRLGAALVAVLLTLALAACDGDDDSPPAPTATGAVETPAPDTTAGPTQTPLVEATPETPEPTPEVDVCAPNPSTPVPRIVEVSQPRSGNDLQSPIVVRGKGVSIEGIFVTVYGEGGGIIAGGEVRFELATPEALPDGLEVLPFELELPFTVNAATPACVWVHKDSGLDGSPIHVVQVPVTLLP